KKLRASASRRYEVGPAVRSPVDPRAWDCEPPVEGSHDLLSVTFDRPLDGALLAHCLTILDAAAERVPGHASVGPEERSWHFEPLTPWQPTPYTIRVDSRLEDLAGNSLTRLFDRDLTRSGDIQPNPQTT